MAFTKTNVITNGTVADGSKVETNFNDILTQLNDATKNLSGAKLVDISVETAAIKDANVTAVKLAADINTKVLVAGTPYTLTDGATIAVNWTTNGGTQAVTIASTGRTVTIAGGVEGQVYRLIVIQGSGGSKTITTWPGTVKWANDETPVLSLVAAKADIMTFLFAGGVYYGSATFNF
jgi:hypothetical protein